MAFNNEQFSSRKLQGRRFTSDNAANSSVEAFTSTVDMQSYEVLTDDRYIPTSSLPFSGSSQDGYYYNTGSAIETAAGDHDVLRYWHQHKLTRGAATDDVDELYFFLSGEPSSATDTVASNQKVEATQQTNFISNKNASGSLSAGDAEETTLVLGYNVVVYASTGAPTIADKIAPADYTFDYKTGVLSFVNESLVSSNEFVYITAYQYVGRTLKSQLEDGSLGGGASSFNTLTDVPSGLLSGSEQIASEISGSTRIYVSGSDGGFDVGQDSTLNFVSGTAGVTVLSNGSNTITIGANTDDVNFNHISASGNFVFNTNSQLTSNNLDSTGKEYGNVDLTTFDVKEFYNIPTGTWKAHGLRVGSGSSATGLQFSLLQLGTNYILGGQTADGSHDAGRSGMHIIMSGSKAQDTDHRFRIYAGDRPNPLAELGYNNFFVAGTGDNDSTFDKKALELSSTAFHILTGSGGSQRVFEVSRVTKAATFTGEVTATGGFIGDLTGDLTGTADSASVVTVTDDPSTNQEFGIVFATTTGSGVELKSHEQDFTYNPGDSGGSLKLKSAGSQTLSIKTNSIQPTINGNFDFVTTSNLSTLRMGHADSTVQILGSASIAGDLIVQGTTTSINTANLNVEDQFLLLNSGSSTRKDGGIVVSSGPNNSGSAFYYDTDSNRWSLTPQSTTSWDALSETPKQYVVSVSASAVAPTGTPLDFGDSNEYYGMMHVNTDNGDIYIYS